MGQEECSSQLRAKDTLKAVGPTGSAQKDTADLALGSHQEEVQPCASAGPLGASLAVGRKAWQGRGKRGADR